MQSTTSLCTPIVTTAAINNHFQLVASLQGSFPNDVAVSFPSLHGFSPDSLISQPASITLLVPILVGSLQLLGGSDDSTVLDTGLLCLLKVQGVPCGDCSVVEYDAWKRRWPSLTITSPSPSREGTRKRQKQTSSCTALQWKLSPCLMQKAKTTKKRIVQNFHYLIHLLLGQALQYSNGSFSRTAQFSR